MPNSPVSGEDPQLEIASDFLIRGPIFLPSDNYERANYFRFFRWVTIRTLMDKVPLYLFCSCISFQSIVTGLSNILGSVSSVI